MSFKPDRFEGPTNQYAGKYFPFGAGPRMCIGNNFAMFEMQLAISELLKRYELEVLDREIEIQPLITLRPKNARIKLKFALKSHHKQNFNPKKHELISTILE